jgi:hypothetical protein
MKFERVSKKILFLVVLAIFLGFFMIFLRQNPVPAPAPPVPPPDLAIAREISDAVARDLVEDDARELYGRLDVGFHMVVANQKDLEEELQKMYGLYGRPRTYDYKITKIGTRVDGPWKRASRTFLYAVSTSKYPRGKYFLQVEIVHDYEGQTTDVSGFGFFNFKDGVVPDILK